MIATETRTSTEFDQLKTRLKATWMTGDYDLFSRYMEKGSELFFRSLYFAPGTRLLDVGCGAGQLALIAARAGAAADVKQSGAGSEVQAAEEQLRTLLHVA